MSMDNYKNKNQNALKTALIWFGRGMIMNNDLNTNSKLLDYLMEHIKDMASCDIEEKTGCFPYIKCVEEMFEKLEREYNIEFDENLISEKLLSNMVVEIITSLPRQEGKLCI